MPVKELHSSIEIDGAIVTKAPLGYVVIYFFEDGSNVHNVLAPIFEEISRRCPFSLFFKLGIDDLTPEEQEKHQIISFPMFVVASLGEVKKRIQVSTREGLISQMKKAGVLKDEEITNV